ncbi:hypothetical protein TNCV_609911 [Trichonephila clavipes]|nr:hypothetical protein TNCV_609911 [Trichonephila clavipes]
MNSNPIATEVHCVKKTMHVKLPAVKHHPVARYSSVLAMDLVISNHGQETRSTPELVLYPSPNYHATTMGGHLSFQQI